ncbi:hypothetical protein Taro_010261, partial [Colocasia esculenta]|nr:hypothetical protein [Colocasia esculenta]
TYQKKKGIKAEAKEGGEKTNKGTIASPPSIPRLTVFQQPTKPARLSESVREGSASPVLLLLPPLAVVEVLQVALRVVARRRTPPRPAASRRQQQPNLPPDPAPQRRPPDPPHVSRHPSPPPGVEPHRLRHCPAHEGPRPRGREAADRSRRACDVQLRVVRASAPAAQPGAPAVPGVHAVKTQRRRRGQRRLLRWVHQPLDRVRWAKTFDRSAGRFTARSKKTSFKGAFGGARIF